VTSLRHDQEAFRQEMIGLHAELIAFYSELGARPEGPEAADAAAGKAVIFASFQNRLAAAYEQTFETEAYRWITTTEMSNAVVDLYISYSAELDRFEELLAHYDGSIPRMLRALRGIRGEIEARGMDALDLL
jgi:hypothetical protein